jgi:predicted transcriptional regulator
MTDEFPSLTAPSMVKVSDLPPAPVRLKGEPVKAPTVIQFLTKNPGYYRSDEIAEGVGMAEDYVTTRVRALIAEGLVESRIWARRVQYRMKVAA